MAESIDTSVKNTSIIQNQSEEEVKAQALLEEKDSESRLRTYSGPARRAITVLLCVWTAFQLYFSTFGVISAINLRAFHCIFLLAFTFLLYPAFKKQKRARKFPPIVDLILILAAVFTFGYLITHYTEIARNGVSMFRGIKISINWNDHMPPQSYAKIC